MTNDDLRAHLEFMQSLGVTGVRMDPAWRTRAVPDALHPSVAAPAPDDGEPVVADTEEPAFDGAPADEALVPSGQPGVPSPEIFTAVERESVTPVSAVITPASQESRPMTAVANPALSAEAALAALRVEIGPDCRRCKLCTLGRTQVVFGVGNPRADLMFVGEAPGADEDIKGEPFVGRAGQLLTKIIEAIDLRRDDVYIANVIKCRPPQNRNPEPDEVAECEPFLFRQIDSIRPRVIVALGKFAAQSLLKTSDPITRIRGREFAYRDAILIPTYHPAYLLRNPPAKREVWEDMKRVKAILAQGAGG
jgi:DNA polymerase